MHGETTVKGTLNMMLARWVGPIRLNRRRPRGLAEARLSAGDGVPLGIDEAGGDGSGPVGRGRAMAVEQELRGIGPGGILHDQDADMADVEVNVGVVVEGTGGESRVRGVDVRRQGEDLFVLVLGQGLSVGVQKVAGVDALLDGLERVVVGTGEVGLKRRGLRRRAHAQAKELPEHGGEGGSGEREEKGGRRSRVDVVFSQKTRADAILNSVGGNFGSGASFADSMSMGEEEQFVRNRGNQSSGAVNMVCQSGVGGS